ncbi:MAG: hypothetical protein ABL857_01645 [Rickettsiales bacterium]|jgi:hypothetical protein
MNKLSALAIIISLVSPISLAQATENKPPIAGSIEKAHAKETKADKKAKHAKKHSKTGEKKQTPVEMPSAEETK